MPLFFAQISLQSGLVMGRIEERDIPFGETRRGQWVPYHDALIIYSPTKKEVRALACKKCAELTQKLKLNP